MPKLLLVQVGNTFADLAQVRGDYDDWFLAGLGLGLDAVDVVRPHQGQPLPEPDNYTAVVVTGSAAMVTDRPDWSEATARLLRRCVEQNQWVLGVCYGHQLLADACGGEVGNNPQGRMAGTVEVALTAPAAEDALFGSLGSSLVVQVSHRQRVLSLPPGAQLLGQSPHDPCHVLRVGARAWGVQFHPEFDVDVARVYIEMRREIIREEGGDPDGLLRALRPSSDGTKLLRRFAALASA